MPDHSIDFRGWIDRLGFRRNDAPGYTYAVQPVSIVRDETALVANDVGDLFLEGGRRGGAGAGQFSCAIFNCPTRDAYADFEVTINALSTCVYSVLAGPPVSLTNIQATSPMPLNPSRAPSPTATFTLGTLLAIPGDEAPQFRTPANQLNTFSLYVPRGYYVLVASSPANSAFTCNVRWTELPIPFQP